MGKITQQRVQELLPELDFISKEEWKEKICEIWVEVFNDSNWDDITHAQYNPICPGVGLIEHTRSTTLGAIELLKILKKMFGVDADLDTLVTVCLLHDVCKLLEYEPAGEVGSSQVSPLGKTYQHGFISGYYAKLKGFPDSIISTIVAHTCKSRAIPRSLEGIALYYADCAEADFHRSLANVKLLMESYK